MGVWCKRGPVYRVLGARSGVAKAIVSDEGLRYDASWYIW